MEFVRRLFVEGPAASVLVLAALIVQPVGLARGQDAQRRDEVRPSGGMQTTADLNRRIEQLNASITDPDLSAAEYRIGANDVLELNVFGAPELNQTVRVSAAGDISLPLAGSVKASGLTAQELEKALEDKLRVYMNEPHVSVFVASVESHPVSVLGEVSKPGVFQIRGPKTLLELLSMAQGLADDAGNTVLVMRGAGLAENSSEVHFAPAAASEKPHSEPLGADAATADGQKTIDIDLKLLLDSGDPRYNVPIFPGDIIKVTKAGIVYVVGGVKKPGGFVMRSNEEMSLLKAIALAEGVNDTAAKRHTRIIHTDEITGQRSETPVDLGKILAGKAPDLPLRAADIVFVPRSNAKSALLKATETSVATASGFIIFHP
jgi:polysaccharide biosynthesis/export protein